MQSRQFVAGGSLKILSSPGSLSSALLSVYLLYVVMKHQRLSISLSLSLLFVHVATAQTNSSERFYIRVCCVNETFCGLFKNSICQFAGSLLPPQAQVAWFVICLFEPESGQFCFERRGAVKLVWCGAVNWIDDWFVIHVHHSCNSSISLLLLAIFEATFVNNGMDYEHEWKMSFANKIKDNSKDCN